MSTKGEHHGDPSGSRAAIEEADRSPTENAVGRHLPDQRAKPSRSVIAARGWQGSSGSRAFSRGRFDQSRPRIIRSWPRAFKNISVRDIVITSIDLHDRELRVGGRLTDSYIPIRPAGRLIRLTS